MRRLVEIFVAACLYYSGLVKLACWLMRRSGPHLIILCYHRARGENLRRHLLYLRRHYRVLPLQEALEELYTSPKEGKRGHDQRTPLVLTFDDGYYDSYSHGFVLARELRVPITIFLVPGYIESGNRFWWLEGDNLARRAQVKVVVMEERTYQLDKAGERQALARAIDARLRHATSVAEREAFLVSVREMLAIPSSVPIEEEALRPLTWAEAREMGESGWVSFGAHTMHHPILAHLSCPEEVRREVEECRGVLEQQLGHPVRVFAYPVGKTEHIGNESLQAVQQAGYAWAVTTIPGVNTLQSDPYQLRRVMGDVSRHWLVMAAKTSGVRHLFSPLWKWKSPMTSARGRR